MNLKLRIPVFIFLIAFSIPALSQQPKDTIDIATELSKQYYSEFAVFNSKKEFVDILNYDAPGIDAEFFIQFKFQIDSANKLKAETIIDVTKDSALLKCQYGILSVWIWDYDRHPHFTGTLEIISVKHNKVVIKENIRIIDDEGRLIIYSGVKTFRRKRKL